jgi:hypothetical protein
VAGDIGTKGDTGTTGPQGDAGVSFLKFAIVPAASLSLKTAGISISQTFFTAETGGNYSFQIIVLGIAQPSDSFKLKAEILIGSSLLTNQFAIASDAVSYANGMPGRQYGFTIIGAAANVSATTTFDLRITNQLALETGTSITFMGRALVNKVGSIG